MVRTKSATSKHLSRLIGVDSVLRGVAAYAAASAMPRLISVLILPLMTRALAPSEYGQLATIATISAAFQAVVSFGLETAVFRELVRLSGNAQKRAEYVNSIWTFTLSASLAIAIGLGAGIWIAAPPGLPFPPEAMLPAFLAVALHQAVITVPLAVLRAEERLAEYVRANFVYAIAYAVLVLGAVVILGLGVIGAITAGLLASMVLLFVTARTVDHRLTTKVNRALVGQSLAFGIPLIPHTLSHWALSLSDRLILGANLNQAQVGVYSLAYQVSALVSLLALAVNQAVMPLYARAAQSSEAIRALRDVVTFQFLIVAFLGMAAATLGPPTLLLLVPPSYWEAATFIPLLSLGAVLFGWYFVPMDSIVLIEGRTRSLFVWTVIAAATNVGLNLVFVPRVGAIAAAASTAVGYGLLFLLMLIYSRRGTRERVPYAGRPIVLGVAAMLGLYTGITTAIPLEADITVLFWRAVAVLPAFLIVVVVLPPPTSLQRPTNP